MTTLAADFEAISRGNLAKLAALVSMFERPIDSAAAAKWLQQRGLIMEALRQYRTPRAPAIALTGPPGAGKSSLLAAFLRHSWPSVAAVAVDPSSTLTGGAILGDRVRALATATHSSQRRFFRSQSSGGELGGLAPSTIDVVRVLIHFFDKIFIETVGVGQSECDVAAWASQTWLVVTPESGDAMQFLKSGILEYADRVIVHKADRPHAARMAQQLRQSLAIARKQPPPVDLVLTFSGEGVADLCTAAESVVPVSPMRLEAASVAVWARCYGNRRLAQQYAVSPETVREVEQKGGSEAMLQTLLKNAR